MNRKAYVVTDEYEGHAVVLFAAHNVVARRDGANELNCDFTAVSCRRAAQFDQYAEAGEVPREALLADGWWFECAQCGGRAEQDGEDDDGNPRVPSVVRGLVFCCTACLEAYDAERAAECQRIEHAKQQVAERFPGCELLSVLSSCYHPQRRNELVAKVTFRFPGGVGLVDWYVGDDTASLNKSDEAAWNAYRAQRDAARSSAA